MEAKYKALVTRLEGVVEDWKKYRDTNTERADKAKTIDKMAKHQAKAQVYDNNAKLLEAILGDLDSDE